jgi:hypothetical protein
MENATVDGVYQQTTEFYETYVFSAWWRNERKFHFLWWLSFTSTSSVMQSLLAGFLLNMLDIPTQLKNSLS